MLITVHEPVRLDVSSLDDNPGNDDVKKPMTAAARDSLRESIGRFGFSAILNVAAMPSSRYLVLDGNTRVEDLRAGGVTTVWGIVHPEMAHDAPGSAALREEFVLTFDAHRKKFDEQGVKDRLGMLITLGRDKLDLDRLLGRKDRKPREKSASPESKPATPEATAERVEAVKAAVSEAVARAASSDSIVLHGPKDEMNEIRSMLRDLEGEAGRSATLLRICREAGTRIATDDETFLTALALAFSRLVS